MHMKKNSGRLRCNIDILQYQWKHDDFAGFLLNLLINSITSLYVVCVVHLFFVFVQHIAIDWDFVLKSVGDTRLKYKKNSKKQKM